MDFKEKIIYTLVCVIILSNVLWALSYAHFVHLYFTSDYSYIDSSTTNNNINSNTKGDE